MVPGLNQYRNGKQLSCHDCESCLINQFCSEEWKSTIDQKKNQVLYKKGNYIFYEGNPVFGMYFIAIGKVKILIHDSKGKETIVRLANEGHVLGRWGDLDDVYTTSAVALEDSLVCFINNDLLLKTLEANPKLTFHL